MGWRRSSVSSRLSVFLAFLVAACGGGGGGAPAVRAPPQKKGPAAPPGDVEAAADGRTAQGHAFGLEEPHNAAQSEDGIASSLPEIA